MYAGHIKLFRKLKKAPYYKDSQYVHLWAHLLLSVNWTEKKLKLNGSDRIITLLPGQVLTSRDRLADDTGIEASKVERILKVFKSEQQIEQQSFAKYRVITITNWTDYQDGEQQNEPEMNSKRTASEPQVNTDKKKTLEPKTLKPKTGRVAPDAVEYPEWLDLELWKRYIEMRVRIKKPMTPYAESLRIANLKKLMDAGEDQAGVVKQSIGAGWQDFFAVKNKEQPKQGERAEEVRASNQDAVRRFASGGSK